jgi:hypothetical protein
VGNIYQATCTVIPLHMQRHIADYGDDDDRERVKVTRHLTSCISRGREQTLISAVSKSVDPQNDATSMTPAMGTPFPASS